MNDVSNINLWRLGQEIMKHTPWPEITREELEATYRLLAGFPTIRERAYFEEEKRRALESLED